MLVRNVGGKLIATAEIPGGEREVVAEFLASPNRNVEALQHGAMNAACHVSRSLEEVVNRLYCKLISTVGGDSTATIDTLSYEDIKGFVVPPGNEFEPGFVIFIFAAKSLPEQEVQLLFQPPKFKACGNLKALIQSGEWEKFLKTPRAGRGKFLEEHGIVVTEPPAF